jgi:hypothetical protein
MLTWLVTTAGRYNAKFKKTHIRGAATYAASPARVKGSKTALKKI